MPLSVKFDPQRKIVETTVSGRVGPAELIEETVQAVALGAKHVCTLFLSDLSNVVVDFSVADVIELPDLHDKLGLETKNTRIAIIPPKSKEGIEMLRYYESACRHKNWNARMFGRRQEALAWLTEAQV